MYKFIKKSNKMKKFSKNGYKMGGVSEEPGEQGNSIHLFFNNLSSFDKYIPIFAEMEKHVSKLACE